MHEGKGIPIYSGIAIGRAYVFTEKDLNILPSCGDVDIEKKTYANAVKVAKGQLSELLHKTQDILGDEETKIIEAQKMMLEDPNFIVSAQKFIESGYSAGEAAVRMGIELGDSFEHLDDEYIRERAIDVRDISQRLVEIICDYSSELIMDEKGIIITYDLTPSEIISLDKEKTLGIVLKYGSKNSHTSILAKIMDIPMMIQSDINVIKGIDGCNMILDATMSKYYIDPTEEIIDEMIRKQEESHREKGELLKFVGEKTITKSGKEVKIYANMGELANIDAIIKSDADGIGLMRSEFLYLGRKGFPSEEDLFCAYKKVIDAMQDKWVIIRTLDIGGDKQLSYYKREKEENPVLGIRGVRVCIEREDIFSMQLRAICRASAFGNVGIMFPMITSMWEIKLIKSFLEKVKLELMKEGIKSGNPKLGIMIETPAAAILSDEFAKEVDFMSVGTNDLTQYVLAADRENEKLTQYYDPYHQAIIKLLKLIAQNAKENNVALGICGELASDEHMIESLVQMGYYRLSVSPNQVLRLRKIIIESDKL